MKVAFVVSGLNHISGISSSTSTIVNKLSENNDIDVTIISLVERSSTQFFHIEKNVKIIKVFSENVNLKKNVLLLIRKLRGIIRRNEFDVLVVPVLVFCLFKLATIFNSTTKIVSWDHASIPEKENLFSWAYLNRFLAVKNSEKIVAITKGAKKVYQNRFKNADNIVQIYNTTGLEYDSSQEYDIKSKKIISAGALNPIKGFDIAIEVASLVFKEKSDWEWHIYGDGQEKEKLESSIIQKGLENNLFLKGHTNQIEKIYRNYSFYVLTSRSESFGMVVLESQINKLPVISFDSGFGPRELVKNNYNGYLIKSFNTEEMAKKIVNLMDDDKKRLQMSSAAIDLSKSLNRDEISNEWNELFKIILKKKNNKI